MRITWLMRAAVVVVVVLGLVGVSSGAPFNPHLLQWGDEPGRGKGGDRSGRPSPFHPKQPKKGCQSKVSKARIGLVAVCVCGGKKGSGTSELVYAVRASMRGCMKKCIKKRSEEVCTVRKRRKFREDGFSGVFHQCCDKCGGVPNDVTCMVRKKR